MNSVPRSLVILAVAAVCGACDSPTGGRQPVPGTLSLQLSGAVPGDEALMLRVSGPAPIGQANAPEGYHLLQRADGNSLNVALFGRLRDGAVLRFPVPDTAMVSQFSATVLEVADSTSALREKVDVYRLSVRVE